MSKIKLMTIIGTRPEIIRLSEVIKKCDFYFEHILVHTGQNWDYTLNSIFFEDLQLREPDYYLNAVGSNLGETIGNIIAKSYKVMLQHKPDALLILGDTNSALSTISAKRLKIPIFHMEAGNRCFDENLPEETNRRIVDHIADVNLCYSEQARRYLFAEGVAKDRTFVIGSPMAEVLSTQMVKIGRSTILDTLGLTKEKYILVSAHREENIDNENNFLKLMSSINKLANHFDMPIIYSMHPRSAKMIEARKFEFHPKVLTVKPFGFTDYNNLQMNAYCVVSDSGTLPEEASFARSFPAVSIRTSTERPEALERGNFILGSISSEQILQAVEMAVTMHQQKEIGSEVPDYSNNNVSVEVVKIIQSYTDIINQTVWKKQRNNYNV
jgi:UDP-N-acetylglucosamine 2-epimerase (non-hydrolysing)